jgi:preprotein translocase subunit SecG
MLWTYLTTFLLLVSGCFLMLIVLLQRGRGGGLAGAFGGLGGQSAFGTKAGDVFTKITIGVAVFWVIMAGVTGFAMRYDAQGRFEGASDTPDVPTAESAGGEAAAGGAEGAAAEGADTEGAKPEETATEGTERPAEGGAGEGTQDSSSETPETGIPTETQPSEGSSASETAEPSSETPAQEGSSPAPQ